MNFFIANAIFFLIEFAIHYFLLWCGLKLLKIKSVSQIRIIFFVIVVAWLDSTVHGVRYLPESLNIMISFLVYLVIFLIFHYLLIKYYLKITGKQLVPLLICLVIISLAWEYIFSTIIQSFLILSYLGSSSGKPSL